MNINYSIAECSEFELYDEVCQSSIFYEGIQPNIANMKRNQIINKMLLNNDIEPYFLFLNEDESLHVGNEFIKLLMMKLGKPNAIDVFNDKKKLLDFGLKMDVKNEIHKLLDNKYEYKNKEIIRINYEK